MAVSGFIPCSRIAPIVLCFCVLALLLTFRSSLKSREYSWRSAVPERLSDLPRAGTQTWNPDVCNGFPDTADILLVMKTGATEAYDKLPVHFMTTLRCIDDYLIFSDMEMDMAGHRLLDALDEISAEVKDGNEDFAIYQTLKDYYQRQEDPRPLKGLTGWNLDKYKFLPMLLRAWRYRQDASWYFFVEADSAVNWDNLRTFLDGLNPQKQYYIGSPTFLDIEFAHGGTGYLVSGAAMARAVGNHQDISLKYDKEVKKHCCGDRMIAQVFLDERIGLTKAWPMLNGEKPLTIPYSKLNWCRPVITMHHMTAQEVSQVWNFEQRRKSEGIYAPILWMDIFNHFITESFDKHGPVREDWDNLSAEEIFKRDTPQDSRGRKWEELSELERASVETPTGCMRLCENDTGCVQWKHHDKECAIHRAIRLGGSRMPEHGKRFISGWKFDVIKAFQLEMKNCSTGVDWRVRTP